MKFSTLIFHDVAIEVVYAKESICNINFVALQCHTQRTDSDVRRQSFFILLACEKARNILALFTLQTSHPPPLVVRKLSHFNFI